MTNCKEEFLSLIKGRMVKCAMIVKIGDPYNNDGEIFYLKVGYKKEDYNQFLQELDFEYDAGYGCQELEGIVWFHDGTWADRGEYDGSEWWVINSEPEIPEELLP